MGRGRGGGGRSGRSRGAGTTLSRDEAQAQFRTLGDRVFFDTQPTSIATMDTGDYFMSNYQLLRVTRVNQDTVRAVNIRPNGTEGDTTTFQRTQNVRPVNRNDANEIIRLSRIING